MIMARFRARTLRWQAVDSDKMVGYKIYWSKGDKVTYDSESVYVQDLTEIVIPDALEGFVPEPGVFMFGITAIDQWGNESDMTTLKEPFHFSAPLAPGSLSVVPISEPSELHSLWVESNGRTMAADRDEEPLEHLVDGPGDHEGSASHPSEQVHKGPGQPTVKFYDDVGFRKV
jgi:hypothetical protein